MKKISGVNNLVKFSARLPLKLSEQLDKEAQDMGLSKNSVLIMVLNNYFQEKVDQSPVNEKAVLEKLDKLLKAVQR